MSMRRLFTLMLILTISFPVSANLAAAANDESPIQAAQDRAIVEALLRLDEPKLRSNPALEAAVRRFLERVKGTPRFLEVVERFALEGQGEELLQMIFDNPSSTEAVRAAQLLLQFDEDQRLRAALGNPDDRLATAAATALGLVGRQPTIELLKPVVRDPGYSRPVRAAAAAALGRNQQGQQALLELVQSDQLPADLNVIVANALYGSSDREIRRSAARYLSLPEASGGTVPPVSVLAGRRGNAGWGKELFDTTATCAKCHKVGSEGKEVGPDLSEIGSKLSREEMYVSILDPSAAISHNYETYTVVTADGVVLSGVMVSQTDEAVTIKTAEAIEQTVSKDKLDELVRQNTSLMPADLQKTLTVEDLVDVVEYMTTLKVRQQQSSRQQPSQQ